MAMRPMKPPHDLCRSDSSAPEWGGGSASFKLSSAVSSIIDSAAIAHAETKIVSEPYDLRGGCPYVRWNWRYAVGGRLYRTTMTTRGDTDSGPNNKGATADSSTHTLSLRDLQTDKL